MKKCNLEIFGEVLGIIIGCVITYYLFPRFSFVTADYQSWLPFGIGALIVSDVLKIFAFLVPLVPLVRILRIVAHFSSLVSTWVLWRIFPFDFSLVGYAALNQWFRFSLVIAIWGIGLATVIELIKLVTLQPLKKSATDS